MKREIFADRRTPETPERMNEEITGAERAGGSTRAGELTVYGYSQDTDDAGNLTLWARRSRFDLAPTPVIVSAILVKLLAASWNAQEANKQLALMGIRPDVMIGRGDAG